MKNVHRGLALALRESIASGQLAPGQRLPSQRKLAATYGVAQNTAREAIRILRSEGLVLSLPGSGVYVCQRQPADAAQQRSYEEGFRDGVAHEQARRAGSPTN